MGGEEETDLVYAVGGRFFFRDDGDGEAGVGHTQRGNRGGYLCGGCFCSGLALLVQEGGKVEEFRSGSVRLRAQGFDLVVEGGSFVKFGGVFVAEGDEFSNGRGTVLLLQVV
ncbi:hypothetical protein Barb7_00749 [Bacteroidales bacterium Barb7]|nr:hypothetical protein Barb7_00749 [Bacteroidales bacterium Barb7]